MVLEMARFIFIMEIEKESLKTTNRFDYVKFVHGAMIVMVCFLKWSLFRMNVQLNYIYDPIFRHSRVQSSVL